MLELSSGPHVQLTSPLTCKDYSLLQVMFAEDNFLLTFIFDFNSHGLIYFSTKGVFL